MAFSGSSDGDGPIANINVTPLVDVMLVLLIIFMVTAPMLQQGVEVNLPKATTAPLKGSREQLVLSLDKAGIIYLGAGNEIELEALPKKMKAVLATRKEEDRKVYIKGDEELDYGRVMSVMAKLHEAGIYEIGLVSAPVKPREKEQKEKK